MGDPERLHAAMRHWYRLVGGASPGARVLELDTVLACVVPAAPQRSVVNAVLYEPGAERVPDVYEELAAAYAAIDAQWTVWVHAGDVPTAGFLERAGHVLDAEPTAMARALPPRGGGRARPHDGGVADLGPINDRAYTHGDDAFTRALEGLRPDAVEVYVERVDGAPVGCLAMVDHDGNSEVQMVAVVPEARGRGVAGRLLERGLADAAARGNRTSTLVASPMGRPVYERLGFRALGPLQMWERRRPARGD